MSADPGLVRAVGLFWPLALLGGIWIWRQPRARWRTAALLATLWNLPALLLLHILAERLGWWSFDAEGGLLLGFPVDLYLGWAVLWGAVPALAFPTLPLPLVAVAMGSLDLLLLPLGEPTLQLGDRWLVGELTGLLLGLGPAQLLARRTRRNRGLAGRALLQLICFTGLLLGVLPAIILQASGGSWLPLMARPDWQVGLGLQVLALTGLPGVSALQEVVERGRGTPLPFDPPRRLVTSGPYAYVANPMQLSGSLVLVGWGLLLASGWVVLAGLVAAAYSASLAAWQEDGELAARYGPAWATYRRAVRRWWPRWTPYVRPDAEPARLYVAESCALCAELGRWLQDRRPLGLTILAAENHPARDLTRMTYEWPDGSEAEGVQALARALEHINLGWACIGWLLRVPPVGWLAQLIVDALGGGPRRIPRRVK